MERRLHADPTGLSRHHTVNRHQASHKASHEASHQIRSERPLNWYISGRGVAVNYPQWPLRNMPSLGPHYGLGDPQIRSG
jgi:hypothetical protein